jgi:hypothetical protein
VYSVSHPRHQIKLVIIMTSQVQVWVETGETGNLGGDFFFLWRVLLVSGAGKLYKKGHTFLLRHHPTPVISVNNKIAPHSLPLLLFILFLLCFDNASHTPLSGPKDG